MCFVPQRRATFHLSSILIWPHGSAPAALASLLFDPPEPQIIGKTRWIATFLPFAHLHLLSSDSFSSLIFFLLLFSSLTLPTSDFHLSILSEVWLVNFLRLLYMLFLYDVVDDAESDDFDDDDRYGNVDGDAGLKKSCHLLAIEDRHLCALIHQLKLVLPKELGVSTMAFLPSGHQDTQYLINIGWYRMYECMMIFSNISSSYHCPPGRLIGTLQRRAHRKNQHIALLEAPGRHRVATVATCVTRDWPYPAMTFFDRT